MKLNNPDAVTEFLADCARVSYQSFEKKNGIETERRLVRNCVKNGHTSILEHDCLTFDIITNRACYDKYTKVLTNSGWKYFDDVDIDNDLICTIDENENLKYVKAINKIKYHYEGIMHYYKSSQINLKVTPNHRMWVSPWDIRKRNSDGSRIWKFIPSEEMTSKRYIFNKSSNGKINSSHLNEIRILPTNRDVGFNGVRFFPGFTFTDEKIDYFLELLGIWITDGSISYSDNGSGNRIYITQKKEHVIQKIEFLLNELNIPYLKPEYENGFRLNSPALFDWLVDNFINGTNAHKSYYMRIPRWMFEKLDKSQLDHFLYGVYLGNGTMHTPKHHDRHNKIFDINSDSFSIYSGSKLFCEDLLELALLTGRCANIWIVPPRDRMFPESSKISHCKESYVVSFTSRSKHHVWKRDIGKATKIEKLYSDYVYCLELESDHRLFVMRNGKTCWCGNCSHELVRHRMASYVQESTRYVQYDGDKAECTYIEPIFRKEGLYDIWKRSCEQNEKDYTELRQAGAQPQEARDVLNNSFKTQIRITRNFRAMREFLELRCAKPAHPEVKILAIPMLFLMLEKWPEIFEGIDWDEEFAEKYLYENKWRQYIDVRPGLIEQPKRIELVEG